ncbi:MAG: hypothetical protein IIA68_03270, partial [Proteobacteria bacterium]|nr:hypothetical protein [Pseudomonadota bacterium]
MRIGYTPEQEELRRELRAYFTKLMTPERAEALASNEDSQVVAALDSGSLTATTPEPREPSAEKPSENPHKTATEASPDDKPLARGIRAAKIPIPKGAKGVERDSDVEMIIFRSELGVTKIAEYYRKSLKKLGWKEDKDETILD